MKLLAQIYFFFINHYQFSAFRITCFKAYFYFHIGYMHYISCIYAVFLFFKRKLEYKAIQKSSSLIFTCSKSTIEELEKGVKCVQG